VTELSGVEALIVEPEAFKPEPALRACLFVLAGSLFAVNVTSAREVAVFDGFTPVPRSAACLLGVANLRGVIMPIADVRPLLDLPPHRPGAVIKGLVLEDGPIRAAIAIEAALGLEAFTPVTPGPTGRGFVMGFLPRGAETVTLLDAGALLEALRRALQRTDHIEEDRR
jgi:chemotaxis signal transduction protein